MRKAELNRLLTRETASAPSFADFLRLLDATLHFESQSRLRRLKEAYEAFDPDGDPAEISTRSATDREAGGQAMFERFEELLRLCNYRPLERQEIEEALHAASEWGVNLRIDFGMFRRLEIYARHARVDRHVRRRLRDLYRKREIEVPVHGRLAVIFEMIEEPDGTDDHVQPQHIYLKLFKNIPQSDVETLLPGARVQMTWLDQGKIILPTVTGLGMTAFKLFKGAVLAAAFAGIYGLLAFLALVGGTIGYGVKSFFGYQRTKEKYHLHLTRNLYYQNLANGRSVLFHLLDEAQEQEYLEAALAYFVLWREGSQARSAEEVDRAAETFLHEKAGWKVNFEVSDALAKLRRLELADCQGDRWTAAPLKTAIARLDHAWDTLFSSAGSIDSDSLTIRDSA